MLFQKKRERFRENLVTAFEVPRDLACREPIVTLTGHKQAVIENYRNIIKFTEEEIVISTYSGKLAILGKKLEILWYTAEEMTIEGCISRIISDF